MEDQDINLKILLTTFEIIFLAELGDKTQPAILAFTAESRSRAAVFLGSSAALVPISLPAVVLGPIVGRFVPANYLRTGAGALL